MGKEKTNVFWMSERREVVFPLYNDVFWVSKFNVAQLGWGCGRGEAWGQYEQHKDWDMAASDRSSTKAKSWVNWLPFALEDQLFSVFFQLIHVGLISGEKEEVKPTT